jgi:hypothetical protein
MLLALLQERLASPQKNFGKLNEQTKEVEFINTRLIIPHTRESNSATALALPSLAS